MTKTNTTSAEYRIRQSATHKTPERVIEMATAILEYVELHDRVSFAEVTRLFPEEFDPPVGSKVCNLEVAKSVATNVILWPGITVAAWEAIRLVEHHTGYASSSKFTYLIDGRTPTMPVARSLRSYKHPRWLPVVLRPKAKCEAKAAA